MKLMNTINFFKKHLVTIIIASLFGIIIIIIIGFYQGKNDAKKEKEKLSPPEEEINNYNSKLSPSKPKRETEKPKFTTTQVRFDQIKNYILSETDDKKTLLPNNLSEEEQTEINKIRTELMNGFEKTKQNWNPQIEEYREKCDDFHLKIKEIQDKFPSLKSQ
jgi:uncharacterized coiled-coil DUF342 family protein